MREATPDLKSQDKRESPIGENLIVATGPGVVEGVYEDSSEDCFRMVWQGADHDSSGDANAKGARESRRGKAATTTTATTLQNMSEVSAADQADAAKGGEFILKKKDLYLDRQM